MAQWRKTGPDRWDHDAGLVIRRTEPGADHPQYMLYLPEFDNETAYFYRLAAAKDFGTAVATWQRATVSRA